MQDDGTIIVPIKDLYSKTYNFRVSKYQTILDIKKSLGQAIFQNPKNINLYLSGKQLDDDTEINQIKIKEDSFLIYSLTKYSSVFSSSNNDKALKLRDIILLRLFEPSPVPLPPRRKISQQKIQAEDTQKEASKEPEIALADENESSESEEEEEKIPVEVSDSDSDESSSDSSGSSSDSSSDSSSSDSNKSSSSSSDSSSKESSKSSSKSSTSSSSSSSSSDSSSSSSSD